MTQNCYRKLIKHILCLNESSHSLSNFILILVNQVAFKTIIKSIIRWLTKSTLLYKMTFVVLFLCFQSELCAFAVKVQQLYF